MNLDEIRACSHAFGNRIMVCWKNPAPEVYPGVRLVRRVGTHPQTPDDGHVVNEIQAMLFETGSETLPDLDNGILPGTLRELFAASGSPLPYEAGVEVETAGERWLVRSPGKNFILVYDEEALRVYRRGTETVVDEALQSETVYYYALFPFRGDPPEFDVDRKNRTSAMATGPCGASDRLYDQLPGIYLRYDTQLSENVAAADRDKGFLHRFLDVAGSQFDLLQSLAKGLLTVYDLNQVEGSLLPLLAKWIGWNIDFGAELDCQRNQILHAPALYKAVGLIPTVEATIKRMSGWESRTKEFVHNVCASNHPERLCLRARFRDSGLAWSEPLVPVSLDFAYDGRPVALHDVDGTLLLLYHTQKSQWRAGDTFQQACSIWTKTYNGAGGWSPSGPLVSRNGIDKYPSAALHGDVLWLFWSVFDDIAGTWHIEYRARTADQWGPVVADEAFAGSAAERKMPLAVADASDGLWLFWLERADTTWVMRYNRHDGTNWQLAAPADLPMNGDALGDPFVLSNSSGAAPLLIFWAHKEPGPEPGKTRWSVAYRFKQSLDPAHSDWSPVHSIPKLPDADYHDREPSAHIHEGNVELFWSSNREGNWSIWSDLLTDPAQNTWRGAMKETSGPYSHRDPFPVERGEETLLLYRSNEGITYQSAVYRATETSDLRYAGSTVADTRNSGKIALRGAFNDFQTYTYDTGTRDEDRYARDTVGVYYDSDTIDGAETRARIERSQRALAEFMPITDRAVFIPDRSTPT